MYVIDVPNGTIDRLCYLLYLDHSAAYSFALYTWPIPRRVSSLLLRQTAYDYLSVPLYQTIILDVQM